MLILLKSIGHIVIIALLTLFTQIGGVIYIIMLLIALFWKRNFIFKKTILFISLYLISTFLIIPPIARFWGREPITHNEYIKPVTYATILLNRNYVTPEMNIVLEKAAITLEKTNSLVKILYMDANHPFINGYPLLPHLSHNDGEKLDVQLIYETSEGQIQAVKRSRTGYGVYASPKENEFNQTKVCKDKGHPQYDYSRFLSFGAINKHLQFSEKGTRALINAFLQQKSVKKIFIEPHLVTRMKLNNSKIRFQGCHSVRHDDHIHLEIR